MNLLWKGARGPDVKRLRRRLVQIGYSSGAEAEVFGPKTLNAVKAFQRHKNLVADGVAGGKTLAALGLVRRPVKKRVRVTGKPSIFISYSHADEKYLKRLLVHLKPLEREKVVDRWDDTKLAPGTRWRNAIRQAVASATVAILLISADFMASDFIAKDELPPLLRAANRRRLQVLMVLVSPVVLGALSEFQAVNRPTKTLVDMKKGERERVWVQVVTQITLAVNRPSAA